MKNKIVYNVEIPFTGSVIVKIVSEKELDEDSIYEEAYDKANKWFSACKIIELDDSYLQEFEFHEKIVRGNIFYGSCNSWNFTKEEENE